MHPNESPCVCRARANAFKIKMEDAGQMERTRENWNYFAFGHTRGAYSEIEDLPARLLVCGDVPRGVVHSCKLEAAD